MIVYYATLEFMLEAILSLWLYDMFGYKFPSMDRVLKNARD